MATSLFFQGYAGTNRAEDAIRFCCAGSAMDQAFPSAIRVDRGRLLVRLILARPKDGLVTYNVCSCAGPIVVPIPLSSRFKKYAPSGRTHRIVHVF